MLHVYLHVGAVVYCSLLRQGSTLPASRREWYIDRAGVSQPGKGGKQ